VTAVTDQDHTDEHTDEMDHADPSPVEGGSEGTSGNRLPVEDAPDAKDAEEVGDPEDADDHARVPADSSGRTESKASADPANPRTRRAPRTPRNRPAPGTTG
jgi:hypothetical protein